MTLPANRSVVVHGHFYQPPREHPWLEELEREPTAAPFHDWNERIERECYRAVVAARLPGPTGQIRAIMNTLEWISFNFAPTLLEWMEHHAPATYRAVLDADRASVARLGGHGNAIATPYHHVILPLASRRDKVTEVKWGLADFRRRFGRDPEGFWLPETAVDMDTLDVLATLGVRYTILAPHQVTTPPPSGLPGLVRTPTGRTIVVFIYDGPLSHDVAFGPLVADSAAWVARILEPPSPRAMPVLRSMATDGETYGHHHRFGEMALAATLDTLRQREDVRIESFGAFLARHPARHEIELVAPTSWSCPHGVERWRSDCGCRLEADTSQAWRGPLRAGLEWLASELAAIYATEGQRYFTEPYTARDLYGVVGAPSDLAVRARELLELARNALRMFTSCGWFFDDIGRIEPIQILRYAARAIELAGSDAPRLEAGLVERLARAESNDPALGTGADIYRARVAPAMSGEERAAAGFAATASLAPSGSRPVTGAFLVGALDDSIQVQHRRTGRIHRFTATVHRLGPLDVEVDLERADSGKRRTVGLADFPERERLAVRDALRREALRDVLSPEEVVRLASGSASYAQSIEAAVVRLIPEPEGEVPAGLAARLGRALALLEQVRATVPFDAQTRFHRFMTSLGPERRRPFEPLTTRFGFAPSAFRANGAGPSQ
ncbi:MAG: DUF3536 domain-containing protein [Gemmatimonadales bacterium]